jgi:hypothetical protein
MINRRTELFDQLHDRSGGEVIYQELVTYIRRPDGSFIREKTVRSFSLRGSHRDHSEILVIGATEIDA